MLVESEDEPGQLRKNVTSPNGTTYAALQTFEKEGFKEIVDKAVTAATERAAELGKKAWTWCSIGNFWLIDVKMDVWRV
jgi:Pyrroline-5-carboxylate reductase